MEVKQVVPGCPSPATPITHTKLNNFELLAYASDKKVVIMTSQLAVLQILDMPAKTTSKSKTSENSRSTASSSGPAFGPPTFSVRSTGSKSSSLSAGDVASLGNQTPIGTPPASSTNGKITHLEWQGQGKGTLAVCVGNSVILYHPVSKKALVKKAEKEVPSLLPMLKSIVTTSDTSPSNGSSSTSSKKSTTTSSSSSSGSQNNKSTALPCIVASSVLSHPSLILEDLDFDEFSDLSDLVFQERMTIEHSFAPMSASFTIIKDDPKFPGMDGGEYLLVGGGPSLVLWKLRSQVIDPPERTKKTRTGLNSIGVVQTNQSFNPAKRLGARIGINGIVGLTFNDKSSEKPKAKTSLSKFDTVPAEEFTREGSMSLGTLDSALGRSSSKSSINQQTETGPSSEELSMARNMQVPWGQVRDWFVDEDDDGNSLFPSNKTPYRMLWHKAVPAVRTVSFSPDGRLFASFGHSDRHVKVWYYGANGLTFTYLAHPRAVAEIHWRRFHAKREFCRNVLMTRLVDGTCMMWEESEPTQRLEFALKLTLTEPVTSVQWLLPPVSYLTDILDDHVRERGHGSSNIPPAPNFSGSRTSVYVPSHAPSSSSSSYLPLKQHPRGLCPFDSQHRTLPPGEKDSLIIAPLPASPKETQDWVAALQKDGSILLWKVKGLGVPKRVPTATLWSRLRQVLSSKVDDFFPHLVVLSQRFAFKEKVYHPALLNVYTSSASKRDIACWTVDTSLINRAQAQLSRRMQGHVSNVCSLQAHPGNALLSSSDKHRTVIWKLTDTNISDSTFVLQDICGLPPAKLSRWDPLDPVLFLYLPHNPSASNNTIPSSSSLTTLTTPRHSNHHPKEGIVAYHVDNHDSDVVSAWATSKNLGALENSWNLEDDHGNPVQLGHLEVLPPVFFDATGSCVKLHSSESLILGASTDGRVIFIWKVTKDLKKSTTSTSSAALKQPPTTAAPLNPVAAAAVSASKSSHIVGSPTSTWATASPLDKPAFVAAASITPLAATRAPSFLSASSSTVRMDSIVSDATSSTGAGVRSKMIVRYVLPESARLSCLAKPVSTHIRDMRQHQSDASLFTGGIDGIVRAWRLHKKVSPEHTAPPAGAGGLHSDSDVFEWLPLLYFRAHDEAVESIRCASFGRMATTSTSGVEIKVWECESSSPNFLLEAVIKAKQDDNQSGPKFLTNTGFSAAASMLKSKSPAQESSGTRDGEDSDDSDLEELDPRSAMMARAGLLKPIPSYLASSSSINLTSSTQSGLRSSTSSMTSDFGNPDRKTPNKTSGTVFDWISGPTGSPMLAVVAGTCTRIFAQKATTDLFEFKPAWTPVATARVSGSVVAWTGLGQLVVGQGNRLLVFTNWLADSTLTSIAEKWHSALPFYHPKVIFELVMAGRLDRAHSSFRALHASLSKSLPELFEEANEQASRSFTNVVLQDDDDKYTEELLESHPDLQKDEDEKTKEQPAARIKPLSDVDALAFDTDDKLLAVGELFLKQKQLGITPAKKVIEAASASIIPAPASAQVTQVVPEPELSSSPPVVAIPDYDPTAYDPTAGYGGSSKDKSKGLFDSDSDDDKKTNAWDAYPSHMDDDSRYNIGGMDDDNGSDSGDDFWGEKKGGGADDLLSSHARFLDDGMGNDPIEEDSNHDGFSDSTAGGQVSSAATTNSTNPTTAPVVYEKQNFRWNFDTISPQKASQLCFVLGNCIVSGLDESEQAFLIALIDTLSNLEQTWLDSAAVRFTVMSRFFLWLQRTNKIPASAQLSSLTWCWALHTADQHSLLQHCFPNSSMGSNSESIDPKNEAMKFPLLWETVRALGIPLWLIHKDSLTRLCQDLATQHYLLKKDPADAALWYLLLNKKSALAGLYKVKGDEKLHGFLSNDFNETRWKTAAATNAYVLLGKQQFRMAVAMFVLGGKLADAIDVCTDKMNDYMLGLFVARVSSDMDGGEQARRVMNEGLRRARNSGDQQMESALLWMLADYKASLGSLIPQAPHTTVILSAYSAQRPAGTLGGALGGTLSRRSSAGKLTTPNSPKSTSRAAPSSTTKDKRKGFFSSDDEADMSDQYDYKQFDIRSGMSDIYGSYGRTDQEDSDSETNEDGSSNGGMRLECTNPLYQHHDISELSPHKVLASSVTSDFNPGIRSLFEFVVSHPTVKLAMQEAEKKAAEIPTKPALLHNNSKLSMSFNLRGMASPSSSGSLNSAKSSISTDRASTATGTAVLPDAKEASDLLMLGELRMKDFLHRKIIYTYIHSGLSRLILQGDLDELAERCSPCDTTSDTALDTAIESWSLDASQSKVMGVGSELVARELEFKCAVQFLSKEIEANRSLQVPASLDVYNRFLQLILTYHSALTPDSIVAALGQFCENRLYLFHHYLLLRTSSAATPIIYSAASTATKPSAVGELQPIPSQSLAGPNEENPKPISPSTSTTNTLRSASEIPNPAKSAVRDPAAAGQLLIRTAQKITSLCQTLVTNPLSDHQARTTQTLANELAACLAMHVADSAVTFSAKAKAGVGAAVRLGLFVASWSTKDYQGMFELLSSKPTLENPRGVIATTDGAMRLEVVPEAGEQAASPSTETGTIPSVVVAPIPRRSADDSTLDVPASALPHGLQNPISISAPNSPAPALSRSGDIAPPSASAINLFPTKEEIRRLQMAAKTSGSKTNLADRSEPLSAQTELFLSRLLDIVLLVTFTHQQEEFLSGSFPNPGTLNLVKTLKSWMLQLENQLKDIPVQIIEERLQDITEKESRFVFDLPFFAPFIKESRLYEEAVIAPKLWTLLASQPCVTLYLHSADYLKQSMRFVRMHNQLRDDFDETERNEALSVASAFRKKENGVAAATTSTSASKDPQRINLKLGDAYTLFKHKDVIQSFCINQTCRKQMAVATAHGIFEFTGEHKAPLPFIVRSDTGDSYGASSSLGSSGQHRRTNSDGSIAVAPLSSSSSSLQPPSMFESRGGVMGLGASPSASNLPGSTPVMTGFPSGPLNSSQAGLMPSSSSFIHTPSGNSLSASGSMSPITSFALMPESIEKPDAALWLESHPTLPFYMSASGDGPVKLWQFNVAQPAALTTYRSKHKSKTLRVRFNHNGNKFAAIDSLGNLEMWRFDANEDSVDPYLSLPVLKRGGDVTYLNGGSVLAVAGEGTLGKNVHMVDTLIAPNKSIVASFNAHDSSSGGATAIVYSSRHQFIFSGGTRGQLVVSDIRQRQVIATIDTHTKAIKDLYIDPTQTFLVSGSSDGTVKFWSLQTFKEISSWSQAHVAKGFARSMSSITGVTQVKLSRNSLYSCGADGKVYQRRYSAIELAK